MIYSTVLYEVLIILQLIERPFHFWKFTKNTCHNMRVSKREHLKKCIEWKMKKMALSHMLERRGLGGGGGGLQFIVSENGAQRFQLPSPSQLNGVFQPNTENPSENVASAAPPADCRLRQPGVSIPRGII